MSFHSGRVTFCRLAVTGDAPQQIDDTALSILGEHAFEAGPIASSEQIDAGFVTGEHLFDTQFSYEKNGYAGMLLFALRIDTHQAPAALKQAYRRMHEQAAAGQTPTGVTSRAEKRMAAEEADRALKKELADGRFRKSRMVPLLWDLSHQTLFCGVSSPKVIEQLHKVMREAFAVELSYLSAGPLARQMSGQSGASRVFDDLKPSAITRAPHHSGGEDDQAGVVMPIAPWTAKSVDTKDFLGNEFGLWLWWQLKQNEGVVDVTGPSGSKQQLMLAIDKVMEMDCVYDITGKQSLRADGPARMPEAKAGLKLGKWPRKLGIILSDGQEQWELTWQLDQMIVTGAALPEIPDVQHPRELIEGRLLLTRSLAQSLDQLFAAFVKRRLSSGWSTDRTAMQQWAQNP